MRRFLLLLATLMLGLVIACGGGGDDDGDNGDNSGNSGNSGTTATATEESGGDDGPSAGAGAGGDFCAPDRADAIFDNLDFTNFNDLEDQFSGMQDALDDWADTAPNEIRDDVEVLVEAISGWIELLEEYDYDFLAIGQNAADDPRFAELESDRFQEAADNISDYCGFDIDTSSPSGATGGGSTGGGSTGGFAVDLPEDFPAELVPPDSTVGFAGNVGFGTTVEFTSTATAEEIKAYYEDSLGAPSFADSESITWTGTNGTTVSVTGTDGDLTVLIIMVAAN